MKPYSQKNLSHMRHSAEHVLHMAVEKLYPGILAAMGPATDEGFYFDFDPSTSSGQVHKISEEDFPKIEAEMRKIIKVDLPITRKEISAGEAKKLFQENPYKLEWIAEAQKKNQKLTVYSIGSPELAEGFVDLCKGPHVGSTAKIGSFKLLSVAGAYWHGDEKNKMLTRIYGTAFFNQKQLDDYLQQITESQKRDHRVLGKKLELFLISDEIGQGLPVILPKGTIILKEIHAYNRKLQQERGYQEIITPHIGLKSLWQTSGHWDLYRDLMYPPLKIEKKEYLIKPMNCPFHIMAYKNKPRSYRDLPFKISEYASVYRQEKSGELNGLLRVRGLMQDDAHIFCTENQLKKQIWEVIDLSILHYKNLGINDYVMRLSLRDPKNKNKYLGSDRIWQMAESALRQAIKEKNIPFVEAEGEAAFYGPKIDPIAKDSIGREWQMGTIQVDFMLPERFKLSYIDKAGKEKQPVMIHRAPLGSFERLLGILIEHYAGAFPIWLAPVQVMIIPIAERHVRFAQAIGSRLKAEGLRVEVNDRNETMQKKIKEAEEQKIPYMLIIGDREEKENKISVRQRGEKNLGPIKFEDFLTKIKLEIEEKKIF